MENESNLKIGSFTLPTIVLFIFGSILLLLGVFWFLRRRKIDDDLKDEDTFDIVFSGVFAAILFARIFGFFINLSTYNSLGWSLDPFRDSLGDLSPLGALPWAFFKIWDGNVYYPIMAFGAIIGGWIMAGSKKRIKDLREVLDKFAVAVVLAQILLVIGTFFTSAYFGRVYDGPFAVVYGGNEKRFPLQLFEIISLVVIFVAMNMDNVRGKKGKKAGIYFLIWGVTQFLLGFVTVDYDTDVFSFGLNHFIGIVIFLFALLLLGSSNREANKEKNKDEVVIRRTGNLESVQVKERGGYSVSYGAGRNWRSTKSSGVFGKVFRKNGK